MTQVTVVKLLKTIRLLYPDYVSGGGIDTYYFGANLLQHILPENPEQPLYRVTIESPDERDMSVNNGIYGRVDVVAGIMDAKRILQKTRPDRVVTIGGTCIVSQASFDYLHGLYDSLGVIWIDAHPDVSTPEDGYPNAHAMVLGNLMGKGDPSLAALMDNRQFGPSDILYVGLQGLHDYQKQFLDDAGVDFQIQTDEFVSTDEIRQFVSRFRHIVIHLDIDVLDPALFHSTYFANKTLVGDGSGSGRMTMEQLASIIDTVSSNSDVVGLTLAEYLPFDEHSLHRMLSGMPLLTD